MATINKSHSTRTTIEKRIWIDDDFKIDFGELKRGPGRPHRTEPLFKAIGEKLPFDSLNTVKKHLIDKDIPITGIYVAHDSMGSARYIGHGDIFGRLKFRLNKCALELRYFSFYIVENRIHEREIETLLIHTAGTLLHFNNRKKRVDIFPGDVCDYESGTLFYERR